MAPLAELVQRRQALLQRSAEERDAVAAAARGLREATATPAMLTLGAAGVVLALSPRLRRWASWALTAYAFARRF